MKQLIKNLFLPLAVFAMLGLGALTLSASNITNEVITNSETASMQDIYTGDFYVEDNNEESGFRNLNLLPQDKPDHCTLTATLNGQCSMLVGGVNTLVFGKITIGSVDSYVPLYEI